VVEAASLRISIRATADIGMLRVLTKKPDTSGRRRPFSSTRFRSGPRPRRLTLSEASKPWPLPAWEELELPIEPAVSGIARITVEQVGRALLLELLGRHDPQRQGLGLLGGQQARAGDHDLLDLRRRRRGFGPRKRPVRPRRSRR
jgi:hypothetical protein